MNYKSLNNNFRHKNVVTRDLCNDIAFNNNLFTIVKQNDSMQSKCNRYVIHY